MKKISSGFLSAALLAFSLTATTQAQAQQCTGLESGIPPEEIIKACTVSIQTGAFQGPALATMLTYRGHAYEEEDQPDLAIADFTAAIAILPTAMRYDARCSTHTLEGRYDLALADCNEALKLQPNFPDALDSRGFVYLQMGRYDEAIVDFNAVLTQLPGYTNSLYSRGIAKIRKGDTVSGLADVAAAKLIEATVGDRFGGYGVTEK